MRYASVAALASAAVLLAPAAAVAGGSDAPTPYRVTPDGLHLPAGETFDDHGHVNIRYTVGGVERAAGVHFESLNNQPSGRFIGTAYLPWSYLITAEDYCITWVQVSEYDEHFGEGGQQPVCTTGGGTTPTPAPTPTVEPTSSPSAAPTTPAPTTSAPTPQPTALPTPLPTPEPEPTPEPVGPAGPTTEPAEPLVGPSPTPAAGASSSASPSPTKVVTSQDGSGSGSGTSAGGNAVGTTAAAPDALPVTGATAGWVTTAAITFVVAGAGALLARSRFRRQQSGL